MGEICASRCRVCGGSGEIGLNTLPEVLLYEWMEGYADLDTDDEWLEGQLRKLIEIRKAQREKRLDEEEDQLFQFEDDDI